jgi:hypothetical protein
MKSKIRTNKRKTRGGGFLHTITFGFFGEPDPVTPPASTTPAASASVPANSAITKPVTGTPVPAAPAKSTIGGGSKHTGKHTKRRRYMLTRKRK